MVWWIGHANTNLMLWPSNTKTTKTNTDRLTIPTPLPLPAE
jgi:hypothetical protein